MSKRVQKQRSAWLYVGISLLFHVNVIALLAILPPPGPGRHPLPLAPMDVALVPEEEALFQKKAEAKREQLKREEKEEEEKEKDKKGQVVELSPPAEEQQPQNARFLSEYDIKVKKETKGPPLPFKPGSLVVNQPLPLSPAAQQKSALPPPSVPEQEQIKQKAMKLAMRSPSEQPPSNPIEAQKNGDEPANLEKPQEGMQKGLHPDSLDEEPSPLPGKKNGLGKLGLSDQELAKAVGSSLNDYIEDIEEGSQTLLNSTRWRFASFFNRIKRQVAENWHPDVVYRRRDPQGNVYGFRNRLTILRVQLNPDGKLNGVHLEKASGVEFLDDEAIAAFRAAEPFPNPPKGLIDKESGMISFRFGFLFEINNRANFKIFRFK
jgi:TonB family protein